MGMGRLAETMHCFIPFYSNKRMLPTASPDLSFHCGMYLPTYPQYATWAMPHLPPNIQNLIIYKEVAWFKEAHFYQGHHCCSLFINARKGRETVRLRKDNRQWKNTPSYWRLGSSEVYCVLFEEIIISAFPVLGFSTFFSWETAVT